MKATGTLVTVLLLLCWEVVYVSSAAHPEPSAVLIAQAGGDNNNDEQPRRSPADEVSGAIGGLGVGFTASGVLIWYVYNNERKIRPEREAAFSAQLAAKDAAMLKLIEENAKQLASFAAETRVNVAAAYELMRSELALARQAGREHCAALRQPLDGQPTQGQPH